MPTITDNQATGTILEFGSPHRCNSAWPARPSTRPLVRSVLRSLVSRLGSDVTVPFTVGGTATAGVDFTGVTPSPLGDAGRQTSGTISVTIIDDGTADIADETADVYTGAPTGGTPRTTVNTLTIIEPLARSCTPRARRRRRAARRGFQSRRLTPIQLFAYGAAFTGGVRVATADVDGDGVQDIITAAGAGGGPHVKVFSGVDAHLLASFFAYTPSFSGGVYVAAGDVNSDGKAEIFTGPEPAAGPT